MEKKFVVEASVFQLVVTFKAIAKNEKTRKMIYVIIFIISIIIYDKFKENPRPNSIKSLLQLLFIAKIYS